MIKQIWINLPVKDVAKSKEFFSKLGFSFNPNFGNGPDSASLVIGDKGVIVMLFTEQMFKSFTKTELVDTGRGSEVLLSIDAESKKEVDEMARKAEAAGGIVFAKPSEVQGWMYGCGFTDLDGHRWNVLYMDMTKIPKKS
jgi:predicted lactoylglutathione lyase